MDLRGRIVRLSHSNKAPIWRNTDLHIHLSQWGTGNDMVTVPDDPAIDISAIERAIQFGLLEVVTSSPKKNKKPSKRTPSNTKQIIGEPSDLIKHTATHLIKNVLGRCGLDTLSILLQLEASGRNKGGKKRKSVVDAIMTELKKRGANEAIVYNENDEIVWKRKFDEEKNFPGEPPDEQIRKKNQDLKTE